MGFGAILLFWNHPLFYHASCGKFSQNPSLHFGAIQKFCPNKLNPFLDFYPIILSLSDFQSKYLIAFEFLSQTNSSG